MVIQIGKRETLVEESLMPGGKQKEALFVNHPVLKVQGLCLLLKADNLD